MTAFMKFDPKHDPLAEMKAFKAALEDVEENPVWRSAKLIERQRWNPYSFEGGSTCAIAGDTFAIVASDTRLTQNEINIMSREVDKVHPLSEKIVLTTSGFYGDVLQLRKLLKFHLDKYRFDYRSDMTADLCAELLSRSLYNRRFFPYYTGAILAGIDEHGKGAVFSYDPIGCIERLPYSASGAAEPMLIPYFDCQIGHVTLDKGVPRKELTLERALGLVRDAFRSASEREITTGDSIHIVIAEAGKPIRTERKKLRED